MHDSHLHFLLGVLSKLTTNRASLLHELCNLEIMHDAPIKRGVSTESNQLLLLPMLNISALTSRDHWKTRLEILVHFLSFCGVVLHYQWEACQTCNIG